MTIDEHDPSATGGSDPPDFRAVFEAAPGVHLVLAGGCAGFVTVLVYQKDN